MEVDDEVPSDEIEPQNKGLENKENDAKEEEDKVEENEENVENEEKEDDVVQEEEEEEVEEEEAGVQIKENEEKEEKDENEEAVVGRNDVELPSMELEVVDELLELSKHRFTPEKINKDSKGVEEIRVSVSHGYTRWDTQLKQAYPKEWARDLLAFMKDNTLESKLISWELCQVDKNWFVDAIRPETWLSDKHLDVAM
ncbi:cilia- and flagella-associated protein 251-like [Tripterygium wilfordii]|uniref:cilia- and flagella-associated protein 251-like n=1 Tax=Tripterygium wilfordii TaxID=458696 RepID=UPI0018F7F9AA|nr:cilia- and flagella-associated protein 251-like [Tripterygium wilfordii]